MGRRLKLACLVTSLAYLLAVVVAGVTPAAAQPVPGLPVVLVPPEVHWVVGAEQWQLPFQVLTAEPSKWTARLVSLEVDQKTVDLARLKFTGMTGLEIPVANVGKWLTGRDLELLRDAAEKVRKGVPLTQEQAQESMRVYELLSKAHLDANIAATLADVKEAVTSLDLKMGKLYLVRGTVEVTAPSGEKASLTFETDAAILSFPSRTGWFHGDLHSHSTWSDGSRTLPQLRSQFGSEYEFMYLTEHSDLITGEFQDYYNDCINNSDSSFSFFPGVEVTAGQVIAMGDALGYGVCDLVGLENMTYSCQELIDNINNNYPGRSSSGIAHPYGSPRWGDWNVVRYFGYELMSGLQSNFGYYSQEISKWREELVRCLNDTFNYGYRPSARTGMDYHTGPLYVCYHTWVYLPSDWKSRTYDSRKYYLDQALRQGKTSVSKRGSLAVFSVNNYPIGTVLKNVSSGTNLHFYIWFCPTISGTYRLKLVRDDGNENSEIIDLGSYYLNALQPIVIERDLSSTEGRHCYWLYAEGSYDWAYTSPIYVSSGN
ncbi:MAG: hypothetical protein ACUVTQ_10270 [Desulfotomaculales bacterium]